MSKTPATVRAIENLIASRYDANALMCDAIVVEWAAGILAESIGDEAAAKEWKRLNARREKMGRYTTIPVWASPMFNPYFGRAVKVAA